MVEREKDKLRELLKPFQIPNPPTEVMENYKAEVRRKIENAETRRLFSTPLPLLALSVLLIFLAGLAFFLFSQGVMTSQRPSVQTAIQTEAATSISPEGTLAILRALEEDEDLFGEEEILWDLEALEGIETSLRTQAAQV